MKSLTTSALNISLATALLVGCGGTQPIGAPGAIQQSRGIASSRMVAHRSEPASSYQVLYSFGGYLDGEGPAAALIDMNGTLYGTTERGGGSGCYESLGCGTVYSITPSGYEKVLHRFAGGSDGADPAAALINVNGTLYGTTREGGSSGCYKKLGCGTVYSITASGTENVLHTFGGPPDGAFPAAALINVHGTLYGTTEEGGNSGSCHLGRPKIGCGTVYSITPSGSETVLYRFIAGSDGEYPAAGLVDVNGTLYGTTVYYEAGFESRGTVYSVSTGGSEEVLYRFARRPDGVHPSAGLIDVKGTLYSTTPIGGNTCDGGFYETGGCGTVYRVSTSGKEKVLHRFTGRGADGENPSGGLINVKGTLYGTTSEGGAYYCLPMVLSCGTVFSITTSGTDKILHSFGSASDGWHPGAGLLDMSGTLYGTTDFGGAHGYGTVFALTP